MYTLCTYFLDLRLQQIRGTKEPFGGLSIITVGDLFQLKPVFDNWIFENSKDGYTALENKGEFRSRPISAFVYVLASKPIRMRKSRIL